jgi:hypothetical protein
MDFLLPPYAYMILEPLHFAALRAIPMGDKLSDYTQTIAVHHKRYRAIRQAG